MNPLDQRWLMVRDRWPLRVKNGGTDVIAPFSIVLVSSVAVTNNELVYTIRQPNAASTDFNWNQYLVTGPFAIGGSSGHEGLGTDLKEPGLVRYDSGTPAAKEMWGPKHSQYTLSKNYYGFECLGGNTTAAGNNVAVFRWVGINEVLVKNGSGGSYAAGHTGDTYKVYIGPAGSEVDTGMTLTACNRSSQAFADSKYGAAAMLGGAIYTVPFQV